MIDRSRLSGSVPEPKPPVIEPARPHAPAPTHDGTQVKDLLRVLRRDWRLIAVVTIAILGVAAYMAFSTVPMYQAHAVIRLADSRRAFTGGFDDYSTQTQLGRTTNPITSELEVLQGRAVLGEVIDREGLRLMIAPRASLSYELLEDVQIAPDAPSGILLLDFGPREYVARFGTGEARSPYGAPIHLGGVRFTLRHPPSGGEGEIWVVPRDLGIDYVAAALEVIPRGQTNAVSVLYTAADPRYAQKVVNATVEVFRDVNARSVRQQATRRREFLEAQLTSNNAQLAAVQEEFGAFQAREQVYSADSRFSAQEQDLMALAIRREELDAERGMYASVLSALERAPAGDRDRVLLTLIGMPANPVVTQIHTERAQYASELERLTTGSLGSTADHPDVQRLRTLLSLMETRLVDAVRGHMAAVEARIAALDGLRERSAEQMRRLPETHAEELRLRQQLETIGRLGDKLTAELQDARMAEAVEMGQVEIVYLAPLPVNPVTRGPGRKLAVGLVLGLIFGCVGAFARETLNTSIRRREDVEEALHLPTLAFVPQLVRAPRTINRLRSRTNGDGVPQLPDDVFQLTGPGAEAYRMLRSGLVYGTGSEECSRIAVASAVAGEGRTTTAANLAIAYAQYGTRVVLIDSDLRAPTLHKLFGVPRAPGLTDLLSGSTPLADALRSTSVDHVSLLPAGSPPSHTGEMINEPELRALLDHLSSFGEVIILDTPPALEAADATVIGRTADACVMVVRAGDTERTLVQEAQQQLTRVGAHVLGAVLNDPGGHVNAARGAHGAAGHVTAGHLNGPPDAR
jgi:capsular exopolysaccharide synthesis family protein